MLPRNGRDEGVEDESDTVRGWGRAGEKLWNKDKAEEEIIMSGQHTHMGWGDRTPTTGEIREKENDRGTLDLRDKCWGTGGVSNIPIWLCLHHKPDSNEKHKHLHRGPETVQWCLLCNPGGFPGFFFPFLVSPPGVALTVNSHTVSSERMTVVRSDWRGRPGSPH